MIQLIETFAEALAKTVEYFVDTVFGAATKKD